MCPVVVASAQAAHKVPRVFRVATFVLACLLLAAPAHAAFSGSNGPIAFDTGGSVYTVVSNNTNLKLLGPGTDPAFSADGQKVAFALNGDIYWMYANGTGVTRVTFNAAIDREPTWGPTGTKIAFWADRTGNNEVFTIDATNNGSSESGLQNFSNDSGRSDFAPNWTAGGGGGGTIAFQSCCNNEVYKKSATATGGGSGSATNISNDAANDGAPNWKPDSSLIAFRTNRNNNQFDIYTMTGNGNSVLNRVSGANVDESPAYSPAAGHIIFVRNGNLVWAEESGVNQTTVRAGDNPDWGPLDNSAPNTNWVSTPPATTTTSATFNFNSVAGATFECKLDTGAFTACNASNSPHNGTGSVTYSNLAIGSHTFQVRGIDPQGNADSTPLSHTWNVPDTVAPVVEITSPAAFATLTSASVTATFTVSETATTVCRLDGGPWTSCAFTGVATGGHVIEVRATDAAGNAGVAERTFIVDPTGARTCTITDADGGSVPGSGGDDVICLSGGGHTVDAGAGNDTVIGGAGADMLSGGTGNDQLYGGPGPDTLYGGDRVLYDTRTAGVSVTIGTGTADDGEAGEGDTVAADVESVTSGSGPDMLVGNDVSNTFSSRGGADTHDGGDSDDFMGSGTGADTFTGGAGIDRVTYTSSTAPVHVTVDDVADDGPAGEGDNVRRDIEYVYGTPFDDVLSAAGNELGVSLWGYGGADTLIGSESGDALYGMDGDDELDGRGGNDILRGDAGADAVTCGEGDDTVDGDADDPSPAPDCE
jgi:Ca2+-binding RTX toxin-like protein